MGLLEDMVLRHEQNDIYEQTVSPVPVLSHAMSTIAVTSGEIYVDV